MDKVPFEILAAILRVTVHSMPKNAALNLRFVCRAFDTALKPILCQTLNLEFTRLSRFSHRRPPTPEGLQTIGYHCTSLYIDLMLLRDERKTPTLLIIHRSKLRLWTLQAYVPSFLTYQTTQSRLVF